MRYYCVLWKKKSGLANNAQIRASKFSKHSPVWMGYRPVIIALLVGVQILCT